MKIIIDGPNNVGKSTFITLLNKYLDLQEIKCSDHSKISKDYFLNILNNDNVILDRGPISELVYSSIYNRESNLTEEDVQYLINNQMYNKNDMYIILLSNKDTLHNNYILKGEKNFCENNDIFIEQELSLFTKFACEFNCYTIYDYNFKDTLKVIDYIVANIL